MSLACIHRCMPAIAAPARHAQDCPRGTLDKAYCDRNGDLVADTPTDPKQIVNPSTLIFSYTPVEDPAVYQKVWDGFIKHMEKTTGKTRRVLPGAVERRAVRGDALGPAACRRRQRRRQSDRGELRGLRAVRDDGGEGRHRSATRWKSSCRPTARSRRRPTSRARRSRSPSPTSNSGFKAPSAILKADFDLEAKRDFEPVFSGKHDNSILGVANKDYEAAAVANSVLNRMIDRKVFDPAKIRSIYKSETFPTTGYGHAHNLDPQARREDQGGVLHLPVGGLGAEGRVQEGGQVHSDHYKKDWSVIRKIDEATGVKYTCK